MASRIKGVDEPKRVVRDGYDRIALQYEMWADHADVRRKFFSLIHVPRNEQADVLRATRSWLKPGGIVVTMGVRASENDTGSFLGTPMYWSSWSRADNVRLIEDAGYRLRSATDETELENGTPVTHLWVIAHAP